MPKGRGRNFSIVEFLTPTGKRNTEGQVILKSNQKPWCYFKADHLTGENINKNNSLHLQSSIALSFSKNAFTNTISVETQLFCRDFIFRETRGQVFKELPKVMGPTVVKPMWNTHVLPHGQVLVVSRIFPWKKLSLFHRHRIVLIVCQSIFQVFRNIDIVNADNNP